MKMRHRSIPAFLLALAVSILTAESPAWGQDIPWHRVMNASVEKLTPDQKDVAIKALRAIHNYYGCSRTVAECLVKDPQCETARRLAGFIVRQAAFGRSLTEIRAAVMERSRSVHPLSVQKITPAPSACTGDPARAKVVVTVFADVLCPFCAQVVPDLYKLVAVRSGGKFVLCWKHFPTTAHGEVGVKAAEAAQAAQLQGKFWEYLLAAYRNRKGLDERRLSALARDLKLDVDRFEKDRVSRSVRRMVAADKREGLALGIAGTPQVYVNGKELLGRKDEVELSDRLDEELLIQEGRK